MPLKWGGRIQGLTMQSIFAIKQSRSCSTDASEKLKLGGFQQSNFIHMSRNCLHPQPQTHSVRLASTPPSSISQAPAILSCKGYDHKGYEHRM